MARFPTTEATTVVLAQEMVIGYNNSPGVYPSSPYDPGSLQPALNSSQLAVTGDQ